MWRKVFFKDFIELQRGFDLPERSRKSGEYPVVASTSIVGYHNEAKLVAPCVVVGRSGSLGIVQLINEPCFPLNTTLFVKDFKGNDPHFVYFLLKTLRLERFNSGAGVPTLNRNDLDTLELLVPNKEVQARIGLVLSRYDSLIENHQQQIGRLRSTAQTIYREWFVRGRYPFARYEANSRLPVGWEILELGKVVKLKYGKALKEGSRTMGPYPVVGSSGTIGFHEKFLVGEEGIVVGRKGTVGSVFFIDGPFYPIDTVFYVKSEISNYYLYFNLQDQHFISGDAAVPGLNREQALSNEFLKPANDALVQFDHVMKPLFSKIVNLNSQISILQQMRDMVLPRLMNGRITL